MSVTFWNATLTLPFSACNIEKLSRAWGGGYAGTMGDSIDDSYLFYAALNVDLLVT